MAARSPSIAVTEWDPGDRKTNRNRPPAGVVNDRPSASRLDEAYEEQTAQTVTARLPWAALGSMFVLGLAWIVEHGAHPGRDFAYAVVYGSQAVVLAFSILLTKRAQLSARTRINVTILAVLAVMALATAYHINVPGELEVLGLALTYFLIGTMVLFPWGLRGQAMVAGSSILAYATAIAMGVEALTPVGMNVIGLVFAAGLSTGGAFLLERSRRVIFRREAELSLTNEELRREIAERKRAEQLMEDEVEISGALARVAQSLIASLDKPGLLQRLCQLSAEILQCDQSNTLLWQPAEDVFVPVAGYGNTEEEQELGRFVKVPRQSMAVLLARFETDDVAEVGTVPEEVLSQPRREELAIGRQLCMALRRGNQVIGVQVVASRARMQPFGSVQLRIARGIAQLASLAFQTGRLLEELEQASQLKSEFVSTMSHELRTPLNAIIGYNDLVRDGTYGDVAEEQKEPLARVSACARELLDLVNDTLDLSRLETGYVDLELDEVHVPDLLAEVETETRALREKSGLSYEADSEEGLSVLHTDALKLKVVLKNLVGNAVKFTDVGGIRVEVRPRAQGVEFAVSDTGVGIPADLQEAIFEPFRQVDGSSTRRHGGVGLGLHIVRRLVDLLGGTIRVESEVGRGSTFRVWIPYASSGERPTRWA